MKKYYNILNEVKAQIGDRWVVSIFMKINKTILSAIISVLCLQILFADAPDWLSTDFGSYSDQFLMVPQ